MSEVKDVYRDTCESCGCEYLTTILYKPAFRDAEPKCPCCGGERLFRCNEPAIVDGICPINTDCYHAAAHAKDSSCDEFCALAITVRCVPVADGKEG